MVFELYPSVLGFDTGVEIWLDLSSSGQYLAGFVKISLDLEEFGLDLNGSRRNLAKSGPNLNGLRIRERYRRSVRFSSGFET